MVNTSQDSRCRFIEGAIAAGIGLLTFTAGATAGAIHVPNDWPTIQQAIEAATDGDTVFVGPGTYHEAIDLLGKAINLLSEAGAESTIIDATGHNASAVRFVGEPDAATGIQGFTITGGQGTLVDEERRGGGIYLEQSILTVVDCVIRENHADHGGALAAYDGAALEMYNSTVELNEAEFSAALFIVESSILADDCIVRDNHTTGPGAVILCSLDASGTIENTLIEGNHAQFGALGIVETNNLLISHCTFRNNVGAQGAAINVNNNANALILHCLFENNQTSPEFEVSELGGATYVLHTGAAVFDTCIWQGNTAASGGGLASHGEAEIVAGSFHGNSATGLGNEGGGGGALSLDGSLLIYDTEFVDNAAVQRGGGVYAQNATFAISGSSFIGNTTAEKVFPAGGAGLYAFNTLPTTIAGCLFESNSGFFGGGALLHDLTAPVVEGCTFQDNTATSGGGMMIFATGGAIVHDCTFTSNASNGLNSFDGGGGLTLSLAGNATVEHSTFTGNTAALDGGGLQINQSINATIDHCTFIDNHAGVTGIGSGGGLSVMQQNGLTVGDCLFEHNTAWAGGGAGIRFSLSFTDPPTFQNCTFRHNQANQGGALNINNSGAAHLANTVFEENAAAMIGNWPLNGGAVTVVTNAIGTFEDVTFRSNTAPDGGGLVNFGQATLTGTTFESNHADFRGGGIHTSLSAVTQLINCVLAANTAGEAGGGMFITDVASASLTDTTACANEPEHISGDFTDAGGNVFLDECPAACPADFNGDGDVNVFDLLLLLGAWGECPGCPEDLNGDGDVDVFDLLMLLADWGPCPSP